MPSETSLKGIDSVGKYTYTEILEHNLKSFFDWGFINKSAYTNINIPSSGAYGGDFSRLRNVSDPRFTNGQVWEGARSNWVWESGLDVVPAPISISGVFVNNVFVPASGGSFYVDYPHGRIVFNSGIATSSTVRVAHSYKWISFVSVDSVPWLSRVQQRSYRVDNPNFLAGSGNYAGIRENNLQLPFVAVEIGDEEYAGFQLGGHQYCRNRVKFYVVAEDKSTADRVSFIIASQNEKTINMYDLNLLAANNRFPLDYRGSVASGALTYQGLVALSGDGGFRYTDGLMYGQVSFGDAKRQDSQKLTDNLWQRVVNLETEAILTKI
jgi:hypothetical protein